MAFEGALGPGSAPTVVGLLGYPVRHSLSPALHNAAFRALGLEWVYTLFEVPPERLAQALAGLRALGMGGANVTIPHKEAAAAMVDRLSPEAERCGAINTIVRQGDRLVGYNTDVDGFTRAAEEMGVRLSGATVLVLGTGGAARAVAVACALKGAAEVWVAGRRPERASRLAAQLTAAGAAAAIRPLALDPEAVRPAMERADLVVNATPMGTLGHDGERLLEVAPPAWLKPGGAVFDLVYRPAATPWVQEAARRGRRAGGGAAMLLYQGALAFELWTGRPAPLAAMREALEEALGTSLSPGRTRPAPAG